jgi:hypothetical protein
MHAGDLIRSVAAYNRAGHAVVAAALGRDVYDIAADDDGGCVCHRPRADATGDACEDLVILIAGPCAEALGAATMPEAVLAWTGTEDTDAWLATIRELESGALVYEPDADGVWPDNDALALAWALGETPDYERARRIADARARAVEILVREWGDVVAIAACLGATLPLKWQRPTTGTV